VRPDTKRLAGVFPRLQRLGQPLPGLAFGPV
jgi:hypothetical protein